MNEFGVSFQKLEEVSIDIESEIQIFAWRKRQAPPITRDVQQTFKEDTQFCTDSESGNEEERGKHTFLCQPFGAVKKRNRRPVVPLWTQKPQMKDEHAGPGHLNT